MKKSNIALMILGIFSFPLLGVQVGPDGSANYSIPIRVMSGVNGLQPNLSINYNSNAPNGMLGVGFQLSGLPTITRVNNGNGINYNGEDTFAGPGGKLVLVDSTNGIYHSENTDWTEYKPYGKNGVRWNGSNGCGYQNGGEVDKGPCSWLANTADGKILYFEQANYGFEKYTPPAFCLSETTFTFNGITVISFLNSLLSPRLHLLSTELQ